MDVSDRSLQVLLTQQEYQRIPFSALACTTFAQCSVAALEVCSHFSLRPPESAGPRDAKLPLNQGEVSSRP